MQVAGFPAAFSAMNASLELLPIPVLDPFTNGCMCIQTAAHHASYLPKLEKSAANRCLCLWDGILVCSQGGLSGS